MSVSNGNRIAGIFLDYVYRFVTEKRNIMGRKPKHPEHKQQAEKLMNELLDGVVDIWSGMKEPQLGTVAEELEMSPSKVRKLLITAGVRDGERYYENVVADRVLKLWKEKKSVKEIAVKTGLSTSSVTGYLPHSKTIYSLDTLSTEAERIKLFRSRQRACEELRSAIGTDEQSLALWTCICLFQHYPFQTLGRGKDHTGATKFSYEVSAEGKAGGRHYDGLSVDGYGNEMWVTVAGEKREKSISRSTVELGLKNALEEQKRTGFVSGPRKLNTPGAHSYLYALFLRFGVITAE